DDRVRDVRLREVSRGVDSGRGEAERAGLARVERSSVRTVAVAEKNAASVGIAAGIVDGDVGAEFICGAVTRRSEVDLRRHQVNDLVRDRVRGGATFGIDCAHGERMGSGSRDVDRGEKWHVALTRDDPGHGRGALVVGARRWAGEVEVTFFR